ncbi:uncharacterized protein V1510DRAFT_413533 [Dipodascopsis tothii]|uniref:uncharacterized protein n=1 Tax=Dipodascopsis tothii TaxID=44089 RepID=UPI0034CD85E5
MGAINGQRPTLLRQTAALSTKCFITFKRTWMSSTFRAFWLPVIFMWALGYAKNLFSTPGKYGIATAAPVYELADVIGQRRLVFVNSHANISDEVQEIYDAVTAGLDPDKVFLVEDEADLLTLCAQNLAGSSNCFGAVVWHDIDASRRLYNYTLRADASLTHVYVDTHKSDAEYYVLPVQWAVDKYLLSKIGVDAYTPGVIAYTSKTEAERQQAVRVTYMSSIINFMAAAMFLAMIGVVYHLCGAIALERERGLTTLMESMGVRKDARMLSFFLSFSALYVAGWAVVGLAVAMTMFYTSNHGVVIVYHILSGLSLVSFSLFLAVPFRHTQLAGIAGTGVCILLAIMTLVQSHAPDAPRAAPVLLGLFFPPMNYVYYIQTNARFERLVEGIDLTRVPGSGVVSGGVFWICAVVQTLVYYELAVLLDRFVYGSNKVTVDAGMDPGMALRLDAVCKTYHPMSYKGVFSKAARPAPVRAVDNVSVQLAKGEISCLLGANGSGKTTTLEMITGIQRPTSGTIAFPSDTSLGLCPQKNVMWDDLTVAEHVRLFSRLKSAAPKKAVALEVERLTDECDLALKAGAKSKTLSGGQKRKLQLAIMFAGGSQVCCIDEVSSGVDPLSRRKIWDILLENRGERTIVLTTHFLDEADLLSDNVIILSTGVLKVTGSPVELKEAMGNGYRVYSIVPASGREIVYEAENGQQVAEIVSRLETEGAEFRVSGPQLEDVFLKLVADSDPEISQLLAANNFAATEAGGYSTDLSADASIATDNDGLRLIASRDSARSAPRAALDLRVGKDVGLVAQVRTMLWKRLIVSRRNPLPLLAIVLIPILVGGVTMVFVRDFTGIGCSPTDRVTSQTTHSFAFNATSQLFGGPEEELRDSQAGLYMFATGSDDGNSLSASSQSNSMDSIESSFIYDNTLDEFYATIRANYSTLTPGGVLLSPPTIAFKANDYAGVYFGPLMLNLLDNVMANGTAQIVTSYSPFQYPWVDSMGDTLQFVVYFCLALGAIPAFMALYPTMERLRHVRSLHYSNGLRVVPLWTAYAAVDFVLVLVWSVVCVGIFAGANSHWYGLGYLFAVLFLYGLASTLVAFVISLFTKSQLAAFALTAAYQCCYFLIYMLAYLSIEVYVNVDDMDRDLKIAHFVLSVFAPIASVVRSLFLTLNLFSTICVDNEVIGYYGDVNAFGGPILYLSAQCIVLYAGLIWWDSGRFRLRFGDRMKDMDPEAAILHDADLAAETARVDAGEPKQGLRVAHLSKRFGKYVAVENVSFAVEADECFALLGPNGAGKSTTFNMIRGEIAPSAGDVYVEDTSVVGNRAHVRTFLGVCPQFDAIDQMNVVETLEFYARLRGLTGADIAHNVDAIVTAVGLTRFRTRMAERLSGGNRRKLSLGIALMSDPSVLLLDEPSSGMDAASKRVMWRTLASVSAGRAIVLTTHSMEEADALASRAGILARNLLAVGTSNHLRQRFGDGYHVQFLCASGIEATAKEMEAVLEWAKATFGRDTVSVEDKMFHGQVKVVIKTAQTGAGIQVSDIFRAIERDREAIGVVNYLVSQPSLEQVFLTIVGQHDVAEEGYEN